MEWNHHCTITTHSFHCSSGNDPGICSSEIPRLRIQNPFPYLRFQPHCRSLHFVWSGCILYWVVYSTGIDKHITYLVLVYLWIYRLGVFALHLSLPRPQGAAVLVPSFYASCARANEPVGDLCSFYPRGSLCRLHPHVYLYFVWSQSGDVVYDHVH